MVPPSRSAVFAIEGSLFVTNDRVECGHQGHRLGDAALEHGAIGSNALNAGGI